MDNKILILGGGKIGSLIALMLSEPGDYTIILADNNLENPSIKRLNRVTDRIKIVALDASDEKALTQFLEIQECRAVISCLPYFATLPAARAARSTGSFYFDLTEDTDTTATIAELAKGAPHAFVSQCGLAPGFVSIVAHHLFGEFDTVEQLKLRVGALPVNVSNALQYALTWSTDGLINEYGNLCPAIEEGHATQLSPLDGLEEIEIDGLSYEAFNTSGGIGNLVTTYSGKVENLNYKTIRYPGHCEKMRFLMQDLKMNHQRDTLKSILEGALPKTCQDVVMVYVAAIGKRKGDLFEKNFVRKFFPQTIGSLEWTAIQVTTAAGLCGVFDLIMSNASRYSGSIHPEMFTLQDFLDNRFGRYYEQASHKENN